MKTFTLLICVLVFILAEAKDHEKGMNHRARHLVKQLKGASNKYNLNCGRYLEYCHNSENKPTDIAEELCPVIFKAYLCDNIRDTEGIIKILKTFSKKN